MAIDFRLPDLGENIESGDIVNVLVHEGDQIVAEQGVLEVETGKAVIELPCPHAGRVTKVHVKKGSKVKPGDALLTLEASNGVAASTAPKAPEPAISKVAPAPSDEPGPGGGKAGASRARGEPLGARGAEIDRRAERSRKAASHASGRSGHAPLGPRVRRRSQPCRRHGLRRPYHRGRCEGLGAK